MPKHTIVNLSSVVPGTTKKARIMEMRNIGPRKWPTLIRDESDILFIALYADALFIARPGRESARTISKRSAGAAVPSSKGDQIGLANL